ncbi:MAG TPA: hypothetical protein VD883_03895, partial [Candidatus Omnitrophota bacterium]|nr:hypothetical protein [Candidatus Omnitrophota bacterium]
QDTPEAMREGVLREFKSNDEVRWLQMIEVGTKWTLRKYLPPLWYEYLRNFFVNRQNRRILARLDSADPVKGWVFRSDERPIQLVELYSGWQNLLAMDPRDPSPDISTKYPDIPAASRCGFSSPLLADWAKRPKILYWIAWQPGGRWKKIAEKKLMPARSFSGKIRDLAAYFLLIREVHKRRLTVKPYRRASPHLKILVSGLSKSGTTALYYQIKNSLHDTARCLFEPKVFVPEPQDTVRTVLAKILIAGVNHPDEESFRLFDRRIWIVRDPRDRIVSSTLYSIFHSKFSKDAAKRKRFLDLLRAKEKDPTAVSLIKIIHLRAELNEAPPDAWFDFIKNRYRKGLEYHSKNPDLHVVRYEDFVGGRLKKLEDYLGFRMTGRPVVEEGLKRVVRTRSHGDWKNWFLEEDIEFFKPIFSEWMDFYGYADEWLPSQTPRIDPEFCSKYVNRLFSDPSIRKTENIAI